MTIEAIQTRYAGCFFRSRLEARWAVFFDHLGIKWEYEPQGVLVSNRLYLPEFPGTVNQDGPMPTWAYLPDFWLPEQEVWVEVKGSLTTPEARKLLTTAAYLSSAGGDGCHDKGGNDVVVLGPVPRPDEPFVPVRLHMHKGALYGALPGAPWFDLDESPAYKGILRKLPAGGVAFDTSVPNGCAGGILALATDEGWVHESPGRELLEGLPDCRSTRRDDAYEAARSARFEHGQHGATR